MVQKEKTFGIYLYIMKSTKRIIARQTGETSSLGPDLTIRRLLPSPGFFDLNPFIMLDELVPRWHPANPNEIPKGTGPHPHRGFTTFTYLLEGELEHEDSFGHKAIVGAGEAQIMLAGSGIVHNERPSENFFRKGGNMHGFQLWINLPAASKNLPPLYQSLNQHDIPKIKLDEESSLHVLLGECNGQSSRVNLYWPLQIVRIDLFEKSAYEWTVNPGWESWMFLPTGSTINIGEEQQSGACILRFGKEGDAVKLSHHSGSGGTAFLFQAPPLLEPIAAHGPFVMNHQSELMEAYSAYHRGDYGRL
jgi:redox-sensitive bicupin YhaK (pirin superfamily)